MSSYVGLSDFDCDVNSLVDADAEGVSVEVTLGEVGVDWWLSCILSICILRNELASSWLGNTVFNQETTFFFVVLSDLVSSVKSPPSGVKVLVVFEAAAVVKGLIG